jgi:YidC/Oxa1 family membrane protein insertase
MFKFFANLFGYVLNFIYKYVNNYGLAIILFTLLLRLILLPINLKQQKTMKKSAKIQGKLRELQDKYSNDPTRLNEEMRNLYAEEHMSPFSGCLSSILQFIIIISMFFLISNPLTYMKKIPADNKTLISYKDEIKEENNGQNVNYIEIAIIKKYGKTDENVNLNMNFLGLNLSDVASKDYSNPKVFIIPLLYVITSIVSMRLTTAMTTQNNKKKEDKAIISDEENEKLKEEKKLVKVENKDEEMDTVESMNKTMRYMMPIMTVSIALIAPLGLALYWFISNLLMIFERLAVNKFVKEEE